MLDRGVATGWCWWKARAARPSRVEPGAATSGEVGVLAAVADVLLAEAADAVPGVAVHSERQRPEQVGVGAAEPLARAPGRPGRVRGVEVASVDRS